MVSRRQRDFILKVPSEWAYFQEYARRFPKNPTATRYGILIWNSTPCEENMLYAEGPAELRAKHIDYLCDHPDLLDGTIEDFHNFINWLEGVEGKKPMIKRGLLSD